MHDEEIVVLETSRLVIHPVNNVIWGEEEIEGLSDSIIATRHITPLWVHDEKDPEGRFVVLGGSRRLEACRRAKIEQVPCTVSCGLTEDEKLTAIFADNFQNRTITTATRIKAALIVCQKMAKGTSRALTLAKTTGMSFSLASKYILGADEILEKAYEDPETAERFIESKIEQIATSGLLFGKRPSLGKRPPTKWIPPNVKLPIKNPASTTESARPLPPEPKHKDPLWENYSSIVGSFPPAHAEVLGSLTSPVNLRVFWTALGYNSPPGLENWSFRDLKTVHNKSPEEILRMLGVPESKISELLSDATVNNHSETNVADV